MESPSPPTPRTSSSSSSSLSPPPFSPPPPLRIPQKTPHTSSSSSSSPSPPRYSPETLWARLMVDEEIERRRENVIRSLAVPKSLSPSPKIEIMYERRRKKPELISLGNIIIDEEFVESPGPSPSHILPRDPGPSRVPSYLAEKPPPSPPASPVSPETLRHHLIVEEEYQLRMQHERLLAKRIAEELVENTPDSSPQHVTVPPDHSKPLIDDKLPENLWDVIFRFLPIEDRFRCSMVCRKWYTRLQRFIDQKEVSRRKLPSVREEYEDRIIDQRVLSRFIASHMEENETVHEMLDRYGRTPFERIRGFQLELLVTKLERVRKDMPIRNLRRHDLTKISSAAPFLDPQCSDLVKVENSISHLLEV